MMSRQPRLIQLPLAGKIFLGLLAVVYAIYLVVFGRSLYGWVSGPTIIEHQVDTNPNVVIKHWTVANMRHAIDADQQSRNVADLTQGSVGTSLSMAATKQEGQPPLNGDPSFPLSTVGKVFFTNDAGQDMACSGTAILSSNHNVVDTAGHCVYWYGEWAKNLVFCPLYDNGSTPYGCWAARDLEAPADWIDAQPNDLHHDFGMAIVAPNSQGDLTDLVGGAGWAYNQPADQPFYAYGYPAGYPFDGQTRQSCDQGSSGKVWQHAGGTVVSIPCNMTGGSSGGPWFIKVGGNWYLNGHNDFISSIQPGHMFSPYYDDTWYALYDKAQRT
jgi:V8-like Glu-specific endopeptidase